MMLNNRFSAVLILLLVVFLGERSARAYVFDYSKPIVYQFPIVQNDAKKLEYTVALMGFLSSQYSQKIKGTHVKADFVWNFNWSQDYLGAETQSAQLCLKQHQKLQVKLYIRHIQQLNVVLIRSSLARFAFLVTSPRAYVRAVGLIQRSKSVDGYVNKQIYLVRLHAILRSLS